MSQPPAPHAVVPVFRDPRAHSLRLLSTELVTPNMRRCVFSASEPHALAAMGPGDACRLVFPGPGRSGRTCQRVFTLRAVAPEAQTLTIDFVLHGRGPARTWARAARIGDALTLLSPRKSTVVAGDFDWYLLLGDESALPAIGRWLEALRPGVPVTTVVALRDAADQQAIETVAVWEAHWPTYRDRESLEWALGHALAAWRPPPGDGYVWVATEGGAVATLREELRSRYRHPAAWMTSSAYWRHDGRG